ncbi:GTP-binding protein 10 homolog [Portunus trituberculatus]|uniref:GTP-binding protein 10 homolog n=1 Tax=Portunus trituberculatus TaxID=210409 RepID=UPI001E1CD274|nr:GTP-binding protein 10 homolog [Portunus trituberculatus]
MWCEYCDKMKRARTKFVDMLRLHVRGGPGGMGLPRLGGVGGKGGDVYVEGKEGHSLLKVRKARPDQRWVGATGMDSRKYRICGEAGAELVIPVPTGTTVWHEQYKKALGEINCAGDKVLVARGGQGGNPNNQYNGQKGQAHMVKLELKLLADVGLVGFPNAGKSTLLRAISRAKPKVASYPFTTLQPTLGVVEYSDMRQLTIADLPGLIEGAWANVGMGHSFLRHVERTHFLLFVVDINGFRLSPKHPHRSATENVMLLNRELELYSPELLSKPALLVVNKMDSHNAEQKYKDVRNFLSSASEVSQQFPEEFRPEQHVSFDDIIPCSAKTNQASVLHIKERVRMFLDLYQDLSGQQGVKEEKAIQRVHGQLQEGPLRLV